MKKYSMTPEQVKQPAETPISGASEEAECLGIGVAGSPGLYGQNRFKCPKHGRRMFYTGWSIGGIPYHSCPIAHLEKCEQKLSEGKVSEEQVEAEYRRLRVTRFPPECPAFEILDIDDAAAIAGAPVFRPGEVVEGTFNDQGDTIMLGFARPEAWWGCAGGHHRTPYFTAFADGLSPSRTRWQSAWHYTGRLRPLTRAASEMLTIAGVSL